MGCYQVGAPVPWWTRISSRADSRLLRVISSKWGGHPSRKTRSACKTATLLWDSGCSLTAYSVRAVDVQPHCVAGLQRLGMCRSREGFDQPFVLLLTVLQDDHEAFTPLLSSTTACQGQRRMLSYLQPNRLLAVVVWGGSGCLLRRAASFIFCSGRYASYESPAAPLRLSIILTLRCIPPAYGKYRCQAEFLARCLWDCQWDDPIFCSPIASPHLLGSLIQ